MNKRRRVRMAGPLVHYADGFRQELAVQGYTCQVIDRNLRILAHLSDWMAGQSVEVKELTAARIEEFASDRRKEGYCQWLSAPAVTPLIEYLRQIGDHARTCT